MTAPVYYDYAPLLSRNATWNFVVGGRGVGKTYGAKRMMIRAALEKGHQFVYLRRFTTELLGKDQFFSDVEHEFPGWWFRVVGGAMHATRDPESVRKRQWVTIGFFHSLSRAGHLKSSAFPDVRWILFDEFILERGSSLHYLRDEVTAFSNYFSTIDRYKDKTRVVFCANAASITNPYFLEWNVTPDKEFVRVANGFVTFHFPDCEAFAGHASSSRFGKFIADTDYARYAIGNQFADNGKQMVREKTVRAAYWATWLTERGAFSLWIDRIGQEYFASSRRPKDEKFVTQDPRLVDEGVRLVNRSAAVPYNTRTAFSNGRLWFDSAATREAFLPLFKR